VTEPAEAPNTQLLGLLFGGRQSRSLFHAEHSEAHGCTVRVHAEPKSQRAAPNAP
jgi:hypothetical protein